MPVERSDCREREREKPPCWYAITMTFTRRIHLRICLRHTVAITVLERVKSGRKNRYRCKSPAFFLLLSENKDWLFWLLKGHRGAFVAPPYPFPLLPCTSSTRPRWPKTLTLWSEILLRASLFLPQLGGFLHRWLAWGDFSDSAMGEPFSLMHHMEGSNDDDDDDMLEIAMPLDESGGNLEGHALFDCDSRFGCDFARMRL